MECRIFLDDVFGIQSYLSQLNYSKCNEKLKVSQQICTKLVRSSR